jgi:glycosyltransferase involved in cell wall biosynthesis
VPISTPTPEPKLIAWINITLTPYGVHAQRRFARELPEIRLLSINTHLDRSRQWKVDLPPEVTYCDVSGGDRVVSGHRPSTYIQEFCRAGKVIDILRTIKPAGVVIAGYNDLGRLRVMRWCRIHRVPYFIVCDSNIADERDKSPLFKSGKGLFLRNIDRSCSGFLMCGSRGRQFMEYYGVSTDKVFVSPYEPDYELIRRVAPESIEATRARHGLSPERKYMLFSGRLAPVKRVDWLLDSFIEIAAERPQWDLIILGDGELRSTLQNKVPNELDSRIKWLGFLGDQAEVTLVYHAADVLVLPSDYEPWAVVINEAVCSGMAVVASDVVGAAAELVVDNVNGRIFPVDDQRGFREALLSVTADENIQRMKDASAQVLADWRRDGDPVDGLRDALTHAGIL